MRPISLEFCGINSFSEPASIDFTHLLEFGIFGIFGDTGSGKSTILDCIGFALYGNVARSRMGSIADIIHYAADRAYVHFEFAIVYEGRRREFRVERELKRKNASQTLKVYEKKEEGVFLIADGVREGNEKLQRIVGLEQRDFEKCIALPQGEFAQFVKSQRGERLKLISRLFDLEAYGEGLVKRAGVKMTEAREALNVTEARLEPYAGATKEALAACKARTEQLEREEKQLREGLVALREREKLLSVLAAHRAEQDKLSVRFSKLEEEREEMRVLNEELDRLGKAVAVVREAKEAEIQERRVREGESKLAAADRALEEGRKQEAACRLYDDAKAEGEEHALSDRITTAKSMQFRTEELGRSRKKLEEIEHDLAVEREQYANFSYEEERERLQRQLVAADSGDFLAFVERHGKAALLRGEYEQFAGELADLTQKYPVIAADTTPLIQRYTALSRGERTDMQTLRAAFDAAERQREAVRDRLLALEKTKSGYDNHLARLQTLSVRREEERERVTQLMTGFVPCDVPLDALEKKLFELRRERKRQSEARAAAQKQVADATVQRTAAVEQLRSAREALEVAQKRLAEALAEGGFADSAQAAALGAKYGDPVRAKERVAQYREEYASVRSRLRELAKEDLSSATPQALAEMRSAIQEAQANCDACVAGLTLAREEGAKLARDLEQRAVLERERAEHAKRFALYERLRKLLDGNKFMEFVAEEYLQTVAQNASGRLLSLTDGRYFLRYEGGFFVGDNFNGGNLRGVYTLSGGETFLVSLSLALSLSAEICARSLRPIEFFFLDEGFGTLDEHLVDVVMDSLERLKNEHFSIGIISHVEELKHRIERKLSVSKATEQHGSRILAE